MRHIFSHTDADGNCAGAIVYWWAKRNTDTPESEVYPINYNDKFPLEKINKDDSVYIVDFSIPPEIMTKLLEITPHVHWIDHHKTAIEKYENFPQEIKGIRSIEEAGCVLTWGYIYPQVVVPLPVVLIGDRDVWRFAYGDDTRNFCMGLQMHSTDVKDEIWKDFFYNENKKIILDIQQEGKTALKFRDSWASGYAKSWGFEAMFEGIKCFVMNLGRCGSEYFGDKMKEYDICASVVFDGEQWFVSLYSENKGIDVSGYALKYGGGGHRGASGFNVKKFPFERMKNEK